MSSEVGELENPQKWRFTWEAQSHIPTLRLFLFNSCTNPSLHCHDLRVDVSLSRSLVLLSWSHAKLCVPIPRVLIDADSPVTFTAFHDHIEVKLLLLLPVGHPIVSTFDSILNEGAEGLDSLKPLSLASDIKRLSSCGGVHLYCRDCEFMLTRRPLGDFAEMPSVNWREVADNWFGSCCCSFGGISEKLVTQYVNSYTCAKGMCLLDFATITVCKDDLVECKFSFSGRAQNGEAETDLTDDSSFGKRTVNPRGNDVCGEKLKLSTLEAAFHEEHSGNTSTLCEITEEESIVDRLSHLNLESDSLSSSEPSNRCCAHHVSETLSDTGKLTESTEILENQKSFLNGFLGNIFMVRSSNLSKDVEWVEFMCPQCCNLLGAYPCANGSEPVDGGVRLFKCYISTSLPTSGSEDLFRDYTLERMFTNQLLDIAKDELSYRTVIKDLETKFPMLQVVVVNTNSWSCTGYCFSKPSSDGPVPKADLQPVIKVLFTECRNDNESETRIMEDQINKDLVDEIFMLRGQIEDTIESLLSRRNMLPPSYSSLQGFSLSSVRMSLSSMRM